VKKIFSILAISFVALFITQVGHEATHGILATVVGAKWTQLNLFFSDHKWAADPSRTGEMILTGGAAIANILIGIIAATLFKHKSIASRPTLRLFLFYLTAYNTFTGFGYLFTDPLFYQRGGENLGDWKKIIDLLGGGWNVRLPIALIGAAGTLWMFLWVGRNAHAFFTEERMKSAVQFLLIPYFVWNIFMVTLGFFLPYPEISIVIAIHYFFGYFGVFWGTFMAGKWMKPKQELVPSPISDNLESGWLIAAGVLILAAVFVLLPTIQFS
jgi:hypothetical protein